MQVSQLGLPLVFNSAWKAHRDTPLLLVADLLVINLILFLFYANTQFTRFAAQTRAHAVLAADQIRMQEEHHRQVEALIGRNEQLEKQDADRAEMEQEHQDMIQSLEKELEDQQRMYQEEARRLTEQAFRSMQSQVDANSRQLDAVNLALQYQRAELKELRHVFRLSRPSLESQQIARLTPAEMAAITGDTHLSLTDEPAADSGETTVSVYTDTQQSPVLHFTTNEQEETHQDERTAESKVIEEWAKAGVPAPEIAVAARDQATGKAVAPPPFVSELLRQGDAPDMTHDSLLGHDALIDIVPEVSDADFSTSAVKTHSESDAEPVAAPSDKNGNSEETESDGSKSTPTVRNWHLTL